MPLLKPRKTPDGRVRFLNRFEPDEESRLRKVILAKYAQHLPEFEIALNTGMGRKEQYVRINWSCVDLLRSDLFVPDSKNGKSRLIHLNAEALVAFHALHARTKGQGPIFAAGRGGASLKGTRHWFEDAVSEAGISDFTWHDCRHTFASRLVMAGVDLPTVASLMGHLNIQMTMRSAHLAPAHKAAAVEKLSVFNALERKRQKAVILIPAGHEKPTDTTTDNAAKDALAVAKGSFS